MTMHFVLGVAMLFATVFAIESTLQPGGSGLRQRSLMAWIGTDNWPAKVGAILLIIGVGALIRYALMHFDAPDHLKLASGIALSGGTAAAAYAFRKDPKHRALHYALSGASLGIAYLCAYASLNLFKYVDDLAGIALLLTVAISAAVYAANVRSVSIAVLSMVGAYAAPAFAIEPKGPLLVLGYYALVSLLALALVLARSWRPLIHLSFLFALGGGLFFGWTQQFYRPEHFDVMLPLLLVLVAIHLAMPLAEHKATRGTWLVRLDLGYIALLPVTAAAAVWSIAPNLAPEGAVGFGLLGVLWILTAGFAWRFRPDATLVHALIGVAFIVAAALLQFRNLSWPLIALIACTGFLIASKRVKGFEDGRAIAGVASLLCALILVFDAGRLSHGGSPFMNALAIENLIISASLLAGGWTLLGGHRGLGTTMAIAGSVWLASTAGRELVRLELPYLAQWVHVAALAALLGIAFAPVARERREISLATACATVVLVSFWSASNASLVPALALGGATLAIFFLVFQRRVAAERGAGKTNPWEAFAVPMAAAIWAAAIDRLIDAQGQYLVLAATAGSLLVIVVIARLHAWRQAAFNDFMLPATFIGATLLLGFGLLLHIEQGILPVVAELLGFAFLGVVAAGIPTRDQAKAPLVAVAVLFALVLQAQVLRAVGPAGTLTVLDVLRVNWPAVISLLWAIMGATLAWASQRLASRSVWSAGSILLVASAAKLILFDFGSLGELENILAVIAAGGVFFAVARLAPIPPKAETPTPLDQKIDAPPVTLREPAKEQPKPERSVNIAARANDPQPRPTPLSPAPGSESSKSSPSDIEAAPRANTEPVRKDPEVDIERPAAKPSPFPIDTRSRPFADETASGWSIGRLAFYAVLATVLIMSVRSCLPHSKKVIPARQAQTSIPSATTPPIQNRPAYRPAADPVAPAPVAAPSPQQNLNAQCTQFADRLPPLYVLYAAGDYNGRQTDRLIDGSGHRATQFRVRIHEPSIPVVLALGAYEPSLWQIEATRETHIAGVLVSGYYAQRIDGVASGTPVLISTNENGAPCGHFYLDRSDRSQADAAILRIFGRTPSAHYVANIGNISIGDLPPDKMADRRKVMKIPDADETTTLRPGDEGIRDLIQQGKLRRAFDSEIAMAGLKGADIGPRMRGKTFVVISDLTLPAGLDREWTFIVERGTPYPKGNTRMVRIINYNDR